MNNHTLLAIIFLVIGLAMVFGAPALSDNLPRCQHLTDCYDRNGAKIIGEQCISNNICNNNLSEIPLICLLEAVGIGVVFGSIIGILMEVERGMGIR